MSNKFVPGTSINKPKVKLAGRDGNAFFVMGKVVVALKSAKVPSNIVDEFKTKAMSGDYDKLLQTCMMYADVG